MPKEQFEMITPIVPDSAGEAEIKKEQKQKANELHGEIKNIQGKRDLEDLNINELKKVLELYREIKNIAIVEVSPPVPEFAQAKLELQKSEQEAIQKYFGEAAEGIDVPPVPAEISAEQFEFWQKNKFKLRYSPGIEIKEDNEFPGQKKKLDKDIYKWIKEKKIAQDAATLPKGWILIDERPKPEYDSGNQMYEDDILAPVLEDLRKKGLIEDFAEKGSRFNISHDQLSKPEVKAAIAQALKIKPEQLELPKYALFNFIGNKSHPEWGDTNTWEWFQDEYTGGGRLGGGGSGGGGLSCADYYSSGDRGDFLGFRLSVRFSE